MLKMAQQLALAEADLQQQQQQQQQTVNAEREQRQQQQPSEQHQEQWQHQIKTAAASHLPSALALFKLARAQVQQKGSGLTPAQQALRETCPGLIQEMQAQEQGNWSMLGTDAAVVSGFCHVTVGHCTAQL
jgi:hypothetical protein